MLLIVNEYTVHNSVETDFIPGILKLYNANSPHYKIIPLVLLILWGQFLHHRNTISRIPVVFLG